MKWNTHKKDHKNCIFSGRFDDPRVIVRNTSFLFMQSSYSVKVRFVKVNKLNPIYNYIYLYLFSVLIDVQGLI